MRSPIMKESLSLAQRASNQGELENCKETIKVLNSRESAYKGVPVGYGSVLRRIKDAHWILQCAERPLKRSDLH